eukprot:3072779-Prymnesium_polylepis.1
MAIYTLPLGPRSPRPRPSHRHTPHALCLFYSSRTLTLIKLRRRSASSWVNCSATGSDTSRGELGVRARRWLLTHAARGCRDRVNIGSRLRGFEAAAHLHAA